MAFIRFDFNSYVRQLREAEKQAVEIHKRLISEGYTWGGPGAMCDCYWKDETSTPKPTTT